MLVRWRKNILNSHVNSFWNFFIPIVFLASLWLLNRLFGGCLMSVECLFIDFYELAIMFKGGLVKKWQLAFVERE